MTKKKRKYLIETSAVPVALGESTPAHCSHFADAVADGSCWTSIYIRNEFIRRWIRDYIIMAFTVDHFRDLPTALYHLEQDFRIRDVKTGIHALAILLAQKGAIENSHEMAKELARLAIGNLRKFDRRFPRRTSNSCGCRIGGKELRVDFNHLFEDLRAFIDSIKEVDDCPINRFLARSRNGLAGRLLKGRDVVSGTKSGKNLQALYDKGKPITCRQCKTIGDAVIVLDQPPSWCLVHIDKDFQILCPAVDHDNKLIQAERAIETNVPKVT